MADYDFQKIFDEGSRLGKWGDVYEESTRLGQGDQRFDFKKLSGERVRVRAITFHVTLVSANNEIRIRELVREEATIGDLLKGIEYTVVILGMPATVVQIGGVDIGGTQFFFRNDYMLDVQRSANWP